MVPPGRVAPECQGGSAPAWALADDVFAQRYEPGTSHTEGAWQPLPQLTLQLDAGAARQARGAGNAAMAAGAAAPPPASAPTATAAAPQQDPWLLAAAAYAAESGAGWQGGGRGARARMLFQYKPYSKQEPLNMSEAEVAAVVEAVFGRMGAPGPSAFLEEAAALWDSLSHGALFGLSSAATTGEVAAVILIKLLMDLYISAGARAAVPLALLLLQKPLLSGDPATQCRVFDLLYNLSIHGELLFDTAAEAVPEDAPVLAEAVAELDLGSDKGPATANWKATVTSAFRATLAASMLSGAFNPRSSLDGGSGSAAGAAGAAGGANGAHHAPTRSSLDGRSMRSSLDGGQGRSSSGTAPTRLGPAGSAAAAAAAAAAAEWPPLLGQRPPAGCARAERFQQWLRLLLFQLMGALASVSGGGPGSAAPAAGAAPEGPWVSALSCLLHLGTHSGRIVRAFVEELPLSVVAALLEQSRRHCWSEHLHAWLISLAANLLYAHSDQEESGLQRSVKAVSLRSDGAGSAAGSMHRASYPGASAGDLSWWSGSQLDFDRLAAFGGMRHVLQCYREAPTAAARRNMFSVLYDYVTAGQKPASRDSWAPVLMHPAHSSETRALGAALLRMGAADALHPLFLAGVAGTMQHVADAVSVQMAALQAANPGRVVSVPAAMVNECIDCLEEIATADVQVPTALQEAVKQSLEAVSAPEAYASALSTADARAVWGCLADCMRDGSELGSRVGRGWLLQLLVAAAEQELSRGGSGGGGGNGGDAPQQQQQQQDEGGEAAGAATGGAASPPALLPEVSAHGGCQLEERRRGMQSQDGLRELLMRALATTPDSRAADCFISAVGSLLAHVRLRCAAVGWDQEDGWAGNGGSSSFVTATTPGPSTSAGGDVDFRTPLSTSVSGSALRAAGSAARLSALQSPSSHSRRPSQQKPAAQPSVDSLPDAETSAARIVPSESVSSMAQSSPWDGQGGMWRSVNCAEVVIATLSLAVEWLLQAPQEARQGAMLRAAQVLLAFTLSPRQPHGAAAAAAAGMASRSASFALGGAAGTVEALPGSPAPSPGALLTPGSRQQGPGLPHRLAGQAPAPLQIPPSPGMSPSGPEMLSPAGLPQRPVSPSMAALKAAAASAAASAAGTPASSAAPRPGTPRASSFERLQGGGEPSAADIAAAAAAVVAAGSAAATVASQLEQAAAEAAQASATQLWSFLNGEAMVPQNLLRLMPPLLLRTLFEDLRPDSSALHYDALAAAGAGAPASRLTKAADAALGVKAAVQAGRPLWDGRAAVLLLLMARCAADAAALRALGGTAFFSGLLAEPDVRVRHYASVFVLRQLMLQQPLQYRRALRGVVARAQSANDEKLLANPYLQLRAMLDLGRIQLDQL
ncbi:hypothetical protein ABPG75_003438 [Micractinium tetrahymenae]